MDQSQRSFAQNCGVNTGRFMMGTGSEIIMATPFQDIDTIKGLDDFLAKSQHGATVLFKHSNTCGVSARAYREMSNLAQPVGLVTVQNARAVSDEIEKRWQVAHETPQVLVIRDGRVIWDASHFHINARNVENALATAQEAGGVTSG